MKQSTVLTLAGDPTGLARLRAAFGDFLATCNDQVELVSASRVPGVSLVILPPRDRLGQSLATSVAAIRASRQGGAVYIYADRSAESLRELIPLARAGARGVIVRDVDDDVLSLRRLLDRGRLDHAVEAVALVASQVVPARQLPLVLLCLEHVSAPLDAIAVARRLGVSRRTLSAWAARTGSKGIRPLTSKCRVLAAIALLRESSHSIEHVAHELHFSSSAHLHNTIRRYTGCGPREATQKDLDTWCRSLLVAPSRGPPTSARPVKSRAPRGMAIVT